MKTIGVLTSGGDTPGMNSAIRAVFKEGVGRGMSVMGILHGYKGLIAGMIRQLQHEDVANVMHKGGTVLRTARSEEFKQEEGFCRALDMLRAYDIEGLVVIGGDGSYQGAKLLDDAGIPTIGLPGTIDNDLGYTDFTIGFDTAVNTITSEIYKIRDTMRAHDRVGVIEVMGRNCGDIALWSGVAGAADLILVPEFPVPWERAAKQLVNNKIRGELSSIVIIAEGAGRAEDFAKYVRENTDVEIKAIVPGYIQRGGNPTAFDRVLAARLGQRAVELLSNNTGGRAVGIRNNQIIDVSLEDAIKTPDHFDEKLYRFNSVLAKF
ncbi:MAG TPA: 6-phosphofructokinase [Clostridia bacterium]|mgnify:CR=1 FL=1|nr:6-phosphofructokinase [Clostridia bacterium]HPK15236.1 6-phosphofructokinase [Clostridia bacterium]